MKVAALISKKIEKFPKGEPFTSAEFLGLGPRASVDQALSRLVKKGIVTRATRGVFVKPEISKYAGKVMPGPNKIVEAYARSSGVTVQVQGAEAVRRFGLSTQVPMKSVFYTSGPSKRFKLGKLEVILKHVSSKKIINPGTKAGLAVTALWYLGKENVNVNVVEKIRNKMLESEYEELIAAIPLMPSWMSNIFYQYENEERHEK